MSFPMKDPEPSIIESIMMGVLSVATLVLLVLFVFLYKEAVRILLTYGWTDFNITVFGVTGLIIAITGAIHYYRIYNYGRD